MKRIELIITILALTLIVGCNAPKGENSQEVSDRVKVLSFNPGLVTSIHIVDPLSGDNVEIIAENDKWVLHSEGKTYDADPFAVKNVLVMLNNLSTQEVASTESSKFAEYKIGENESISIDIFAGDKPMGNLFVGKFEFKTLPAKEPGRQPETIMRTYIRRQDENIVYIANGALRSNFQGGIIPFMNRLLVNVDANNISKVTFTGPGQNTVMDLSTSKPTINGIHADSIKTLQYLNSIAHLRGHGFIDNADLSKMKPIYTAMIEGNGFSPVQINAYAMGADNGYYITSTYNPGAVFDGMKRNLIEKIFVAPENFLK